MTGTFAYLAQNEERIPRILAGLNLDMVGEKQELCQGPLVVEYPPQAAKSFVGDLMANVLEAVTEEAKNLSGGSSYALFKYAVTPFSGGSDHYVLSDPTVGIPSPMLIQWPDKFYHTSADTLDKVDPQMLYRVGCMSGTYAYLLANLTEQDTDLDFGAQPCQLYSAYRSVAEIGPGCGCAAKCSGEVSALSGHRRPGSLSMRIETS